MARSKSEAMELTLGKQTTLLAKKDLRPIGYYCRRCDELCRDKNRLCDCCLLYEDPDDVAQHISSHWAAVGIPVLRGRGLAGYGLP